MLEVGGAGRERLRDVPAKALGGLVRNPILWGLAGGIALNLLGLRLPAALARWTELVAGAAVPCALFSTGASLRSYRIAGALQPALVMVALKLVVCPLAVWALATLVFEMPPLWAKVAIVLAAMPVGVNVYLFGVRYHAGEAESATAVLLVQHPLARDPLGGARLAPCRAAAERPSSPGRARPTYLYASHRQGRRDHAMPSTQPPACPPRPLCQDRDRARPLHGAPCRRALPGRRRLTARRSRAS